MIQIVELIQSFAIEWLVVITTLLGVVFLLQSVVKNHLLKQRIGELGIVCVLLWTLLAIVPMPRWSPRLSSDDSLVATQQPMKPLPSQHESMDSSLVQKPSFQVRNEVWKDETSPPISSLNLKLPEGSSQFDRVESDPTPELSSNAPNNHSIPTWGSEEKKTVAVAVYLLGSLLIALWIGIGYVVLAIVWLKGRPANPNVRAMFENLRPQSGPTATLRIGNCDRTFIFGLLRPKIVLSHKVQNRGSREQITSLLLHELAHCQQRDVWGRALFNLAMPLLYFHPIYWICRRQSDLSAEVIADHVATQQVDLKTYVQALIDVCRQVAIRKDWLASCSYRGIASFFTKRMKAVLGTHTQLISLSGRAQIACGLFTIAVALSTASVIGYSRDVGGQEPQRLEAVRNSLSGRKSSLELAANRLPANTEVYIALDASSIQKWSPEHFRLLTNVHDNEQGPGRLTEIQVAKREIARMLDAVAVSENDLLELAKGQVVFAACPVKESSSNEKPATVLIVETSGGNSGNDKLLGRIKASLPNASLNLLTINRTQCFEISNRERSVYLLRGGDQLLLTDNRELLDDLFSKKNRLANDPLFLRARTNATKDSADSDVDVFGFVRPVEFALRLNDQWSEDSNPPPLVQGAQFYLKTLFGDQSRPPADSFAFVVQEEHDELATTCWLGARHDVSSETDFLNALQQGQWDAKGPAGLQGRAVLNINCSELLEFIEPIVDQNKGMAGSFRRALQNLRNDPQGPRFDIAGFAARLDSEVTYSWQFVSDHSTAEWMLEIPITQDVDICREDLGRLLEVDFDLTIPPKGPGIEFWVLRSKDNSAKADVTQFENEFGGLIDDERQDKEIVKEVMYPRRCFGIINDRLITASSPEMLLGMHDQAVAGRGLNSTNDYNRVVKRMVQFGSARSPDSNHGFWFERLPHGLLGRVLQKEESGWRIHSVLQSNDDR